MQINSVMAGLSDAASLAKGRSSAGLAATTPAPVPTPPQVLNGNSAAVRTILAKYDVNDITPNEFSQMTQQLYSAGAISQTDLQNLNGVRTDLLAAGAKPDDSLDLEAFYTQKVSDVQSQLAAAPPSAQQQQLSPLLNRLDWVEKFKTLSEEPAGGISALA